MGGTFHFENVSISECYFLNLQKLKRNFPSPLQNQPAISGLRPISSKKIPILPIKAFFEKNLDHNRYL